MADSIIKTSSGYERDDGSARYVYDASGKYLGQFQPDVLSEEAGAGEMWLKTYDGDKCYHELTVEQMSNV